MSRQVAAAGALLAASARVKKADKAARVAYQDLAKVARSAFKRQPEALATLGLTTSMPAAQPPFITMGLALFDNAMSTPSLAEALLGYGFTTERLGSLRGKIVALIEERRLYGLANGASQQATTEQNQAMAALADEMSSLRTIAKVALRDKPQLLEKLGIVQRTTRTAAQRGAAKKAAATRQKKKNGE